MLCIWAKMPNSQKPGAKITGLIKLSKLSIHAPDYKPMASKPVEEERPNGCFETRKYGQSPECKSVASRYSFSMRTTCSSKDLSTLASAPAQAQAKRSELKMTTSRCGSTATPRTACCHSADPSVMHAKQDSMQQSASTLRAATQILCSVGFMTCLYFADPPSPAFCFS